LWRRNPRHRPTGDPPVLTTGATASRWRCRTADPPVGAWWRAPMATRPPPEPARQRRGGVGPPAARPRRDRGVPTAGHCPVGKAPSATAGAAAPRGRRPTGDTPFATTGAPAPRGRRPTGDAPSVTAGATTPWGRRPTGAAPSVTAGPTASSGRCPTGDTPTSNRAAPIPGCVALPMRSPPRAAQQRRSGVALTAIRPLQNRLAPTPGCASPARRLSPRPV